MVNVFVYGTLKPGGRFHAEYCQGLLRAIPAWTYGYLYDLPGLGYPAMTEGNNPWELGEANRVYGYCLTFEKDPLELGEAHRILNRLDALEDYDPQRPEQDNEYLRHWVTVMLCPENSPAYWGEAWTYRMSMQKILTLGGIFCPHGTWP